MDIKELLKKINDINQDVSAKNEVIKMKHNEQAKIINNDIAKLETNIDAVITDLKAGKAGALAWAKDKLYTQVYDIEVKISTLQNDIANYLFDNKLNSIGSLCTKSKIFIKNAFTKIGINPTDEQIDAATNIVPLNFSNIINTPDIEVASPLPDLVTMLNMRANGEELPRMPLL